MSKRSRLTVEVLIRMPLPAGVKADKALIFVREAMHHWRNSLRADDATHMGGSIAVEQAVVKLVKRETVYL